MRLPYVHCLLRASSPGVVRASAPEITGLVSPTSPGVTPVAHKLHVTPHVLSFRLVVFRFPFVFVSPTSLFFSLPPCVLWLLILSFCYFVSALTPPRAPCEPQVCVLPLRSAFSCVVDVDLFSSVPSLFRFFRFRFEHPLFHPVFFLWVLRCLLGFGFCCDSFSM